MTYLPTAVPFASSNIQLISLAGINPESVVLLQNIWINIEECMSIYLLVQPFKSDCGTLLCMLMYYFVPNPFFKTERIDLKICEL